MFVSSTFRDLTEERQAVVTTLLAVDAFPAGMELFPATNDDAWTLIESVIQDSDYYLLVIGGKYGSVDATLDISYTQREYETAARLGKPIMAFLHGAPDKLTVEASETDPERRAKLEAFRALVQGAHHVKYWTSAEDLAGKVALTWNQFIRRYPATGWIRADQASSHETLEELARAGREVEQLKAQLQQTRTQPPRGTDQLAQGDDLVELRVEATGDWGELDMLTDSFTATLPTQLTWNQMFGVLGLAMLDEASVGALNGVLSTYIKQNEPEIPIDWGAQAAEHGAAHQRYGGSISTEFKSLSVAGDDLRAVLHQYQALGLIALSERRRPIADKATYWTLTDYGRTHLQRMRAIPRGSRALTPTMPTPEEAASGDD